MTDYEQLRDQLIGHEGLRLTPYRDTVGKLTIGVGRNLEDRGISRAEALYLLDNDITACLVDLRGFPWFDRLDPVRQRVLVDMRFNLGAKGLRTFVRTLAAIAAGRYADAADRMLESKWARQVGRRATRLSWMMRTGIDA